MDRPKSRSNSGKMIARDAFKRLNLPSSASIEEINKTFKAKLDALQKKYADKPDKLVQEADALYSAYRSAYISKDGPEEGMLPLTITGPDAMLSIFGIGEVPHDAFKVRKQSQAVYRNGELVENASSQSESFINKDGKKETKVYKDGKLVKHTIGDKNQLQ